VLALIVSTTSAILWSSGNVTRPIPPTRTRAPAGSPQAGTSAGPVPTLPAESSGSAVIAGAAPVSWDPAQIGDVGSAGLLAQVFESLTTLDSKNRLQPALAKSWSVDGGGRSITFQLRPGIAFSDGTPITADDVRRSWLHVLDPKRPSPLASLLSDVVGASDYSSGRGSADRVGIDALDGSVVVHFRRPAAYFVSAASSPTLAVVPPVPDEAAGPVLPTGLVASGAYVPESETGSAIQLTANQRYWAGPPPIESITVATSFGGNSPVDAFQAGTVDYSPVSRDDASWIPASCSSSAGAMTATTLATAFRTPLPP
jgi:oligopeptide transport system substrate-binding protein